jgi:hypothetical protein
MGPKGMQILRGKGSEFWFGSVVGLSTKRLNLGRDTSHIADWELVRMFGERKHNKGYCYDTARSKKVRLRTWELYMPLYQENMLPHDSYIRESFARAIVSEIYHNHHMNWARYVEDTWYRQKTTFDRGCLVQYYKPVEEGNTYDSTMRRRLALEIEDDKNNLKNSVEEHAHAVDEPNRHEDVRCGGTSEAEIEFRARIEREILGLWRSLEHGKCDLSFGHKYLDMNESSPPNPVMVSHYRHEIVDVELVINEAKEKLQKALVRLDKLDEPYNAAKKRESNLKVVVQTKRCCLETSRKSKLGLIRKLRINGHIQFELCPSRFMYDSGGGVEKLQIQIDKCACCKTPFLLFDIVIAPYLCPYHPWCAAFQTSCFGMCATTECRRTLTKEWQRSMGHISFQSNLIQSNL